jgi:hypothetical protein
MLSHSSSTSSRTLRQEKRKNTFTPLLSSSPSNLRYPKFVSLFSEHAIQDDNSLKHSSQSRKRARSSSYETTQHPRRKGGGLQVVMVGIWNKIMCNTFLFVEKTTVFMWQSSSCIRSGLLKMISTQNTVFWNVRPQSSWQTTKMKPVSFSDVGTYWQNYTVSDFRTPSSEICSSLPFKCMVSEHLKSNE